MRRSLLAAPLVTILVLAGCGETADPSADEISPPEDDLATVVSWMTGSFGSGAQAAQDPDYYDIRLEMVPIWRELDEGSWLYVEQAAASSLDEPYRQRVYRVTRDADGALRSEVYSLPDPLRFAGAWRQEHPLSEIGPDELEIRDGCAVILRRTGADRFEGSTDGTGCESRLRGAQYATSEVRVFADRIESWDRGFDTDGSQVWGAQKGAYVFLKDPGGAPE